MSDVTTTYYNTDDLIAGQVQTQQVKLAEDTYYRGMPLEYDAANDRYCYYGTSTDKIRAIFLEDENCGDGVEKSDNEYGSVIMGGEISENGIVDDSGNAYTITEDIIADWADYGFFIKRK